MKLQFLKHPTTGQSDPILTLAMVAGAACVIKFLLEGVSIKIGGHAVSLGHADSLTYGALLAPILGAHGYMNKRYSEKPKQVDNPDEN